MYCNNCGTQIPEGAAQCDNCGASEPAPSSPAQPRTEARTFDYRTVNTNRAALVEIVDCYEALGWELATKNDSCLTNSVTLSFRRNRKIKAKDRLNRLQMKLDDHINGIGVLEQRKTQKASTVAIILGVIGALFFGSAMCLCMPDVFAPTPELWMYIAGGVLAVIGTIFCTVSYPAYKKIRAKATMSLNEQIDKKRDEITQICETAQALLQQ